MNTQTTSKFSCGLWLAASAVALQAGCEIDTGSGVATIHGPLPADVVATQVAQVTGNVLAPMQRNQADAPKQWTSSHAMVGKGGYLYIADRDRNALVVMRQAPLQVVQTLPVAGSPERATVGPDGTVYVAPRQGDAILAFGPSGVPEAPLLDSPKAIAVGLEPRGFALNPEASRLYAILGGKKQLVAVELATGKQHISTLEATPTAIAVGGQHLIVALDNGSVRRFVSNSESLEPSKVAGPLVTSGSSMVSACPDGNRKARRTLGAAWEPAGDQLLAARVVAAPGTLEDITAANVPSKSKTGSSSGGYGGAAKAKCNDGPRRPIEPSVLAVRPGSVAPAREIAGTPFRPSPGAPALAARFDQPADVAIHPSRLLAAVPATGTDNVLLIHTPPSLQGGAAVEAGVLKSGHAPAAVAFSDDGRFAYTLDTHQVAVSRFDLGPWLKGAAPGSLTEAPPVELAAVDQVAYGADTLPEAARLGRRTFTFAGNANLSKDGVFACATCHADGGEDKLVWMVAEGPRQTPSLAGRLDGTAPFNWKGSEGDLQHNMVKTVHRMGGAGLTQAELASLEQFLLVGLPKGPPNPHRLPSGELTQAQARGKDIFNRADVACGSCHLGGVGVDGNSHDVGTAATGDKIAASFAGSSSFSEVKMSAGRFDTPSLRDLWHTAPYFHDGSAATLEAVLARPGMGNASKLSSAERADLIEYLKSL
ncbi:MAG: c-type cytochrome [Deltaproteobacteria bacterium]|nr:c-type cytochrome [Deltaproteobacteria bacterium]